MSGGGSSGLVCRARVNAGTWGELGGVFLRV